MSRIFALVLASLVLAVPALGVARGAPERGLETGSVGGGFSRRFVAETVPATLPKAVETKSAFAGLRVTAEVGAD